MDLTETIPTFPTTFIDEEPLTNDNVPSETQSTRSDLGRFGIRRAIFFQISKQGVNK